MENLKQKYVELLNNYSKIEEELKAERKSTQASSPKLQKQLAQVQEELIAVKLSLADSIEDKTALSLKLDVIDS